MEAEAAIVGLRVEFRRAQVARWCALTRETLPEMAAAQSWPIRFDHCFMRVCLDTALGAPWTEHIGKPAIRTMSDAQLAAAIVVAERIVAEPARLAALNDASLRGRRAARLASSGGTCRERDPL